MYVCIWNGSIQLTRNITSESHLKKTIFIPCTHLRCGAHCSFFLTCEGLWHCNCMEPLYVVFVCVFFYLLLYIYFLSYKTNPCLLQLLRMLQGRFAVELQKCFVDYTNSPDLLFVGGWADNDWIHMYGWTCIIYSPILSRSVYFHRHSWCLNDEQWAIMHCGLFWIAADTRYHKYTISGVKCCVYFCQFC